MTTVRYATAEDVLRWYGGPPPFSMRAAVAEVDGQLVAIGGIGLAGDHLQLFSSVALAGRAHVVTLARLAHLVRGMIAGPVIALQDCAEPTSARLLEWCGLANRGNGIWSN